MIQELNTSKNEEITEFKELESNIKDDLNGLHSTIWTAFNLKPKKNKAQDGIDWIIEQKI